MQIKNNASLAEYTNYKIGGTTPALYIVDDVADLKRISKRDIFNAHILGGGTNILVSDHGVRKAVIKVDFKDITIDKITHIMSIGSGAVLTDAAKLLAENGYAGLTHVSGIPGTIGGAVVMNASASHGAISDYLIDVEVLDRRTREIKVFQKSECGFGFRSSIFQNGDYIITMVRFQLEQSSRPELISLYNEILKYREKNYPLTFPSAGCWFRRDWGGKDIIIKTGMVGVSNGGAVISPMFPAFILNTGNATAEEVYSLVVEIQNRAKNIGEDMPCEIVVWGEIWKEQ